MNQDTVNKSVLLLLLLVISALFLSMIQQFLMAIFLAGLFSALARPVYHYFEKLFGGRHHLAAHDHFFDQQGLQFRARRIEPGCHPGRPPSDDDYVVTIF